MAKVAIQTAPAGADATKVAPRSDSATGREQFVMEIAVKASERLKVQPKDRVWARIMDTVMGWSFVVGLFVWTYVLRLFRPKRN